ncbi:MAG: acetyl-CoA carboxylase biotin carboxyl carrier protein subunit [SAR202 cluster bacterium]|nr:acetyl-CoA carboxylase biotin carboxyl carrier protein subunit [SAR202 cluster bacterium]MDP7104029.1 acetyl-CoA carboxylase biotin carboxyl carrier protein subunit [SAR202 cluster bacterium]MDP7225586.1 acetyl-CoA carboxylase biotin carboxyl carrier protein subunit [SAR202 cluster bacterium]MDP7413299.1 acetyl-CoA carboxylase biotin carboxyl carrier protein subunit [SAR202 cluster bacterium]MDP7534995.1 acetyl-CoA carboxylase biotin carboxyl carrier protein subunit [SAR202 cluster bacterium
MADKVINSPMTGKVIEIAVQDGATVSEGDLLIVIESMKMENELFADQDGTIAKILVEDEQNVSENDPLVEFA